MPDSKVKRVLILEDNQDDADLMIYYLNKSGQLFQSKVIKEKNEFKKIIEEDTFDVIVSDYNLIGFNAQEALEIANEHNYNVPFIICSDAIGEHLAIKLLKDGIRDILEKKNMQKLPNVISREIESHELLEQKKKAEETLRSTLESLEYKIEERTKELQAAYKDIKDSEERYHRILSSIHDIVYSVDIKSKEFVYLSPAFERILGYTWDDIKTMGGREKFLSSIIQKNKFSEQLDFLLEISKKHSDTNRIWVAWFKCKDGSLVCLEDKWTPYYENGTLVRTDGILRNITDRVLTEANLKVSEDRINSVYLLKQLATFEEEDIYNFALSEICRLTQSSISFFYKVDKKELGMVVLSQGGPEEFDQESEKIFKDNMLRYVSQFASIKEPKIDNTDHIIPVNSKKIVLSNILAVPIVENGEVKAVTGIANKFEEYNDSDVLEVDLYLNEMWKLIIHKKSEEKLRKLSAVVEQSPVAIAIADLLSVTEYVNPKYTEMTGFTIDEVVGKTLFNNDENIIDGTKYLEIMEALADKRGWKGELQNYKKNYEIYWESVTITPLKNSMAETTHYIMIKEDITERKNVQQQLDNERDEQRTALSLIAEGVIKTDTNNVVLNCNKTVEDIFGYSNEELFGININDFFEKIELRQEKENVYSKHNNSPMVFEKILESKKSGRFRGISKNKGNKIIIIDFTYLKDKNNENLGKIYIIKDLTDIILMEQQINLSQKLESIGSLAAGIAHEINTPLQFVGDNNRFLQESTVLICETIEDYLNICNGNSHPENMIKRIPEVVAEELIYIKSEIPKAIHQSLEGIERVSKIVRAMKDFAHPGGSMKNESDLNHNIEVTVNISRNKWKYVADIQLDLDPSLPKVNCYIDEVNQVILNLIVNSAHAIEEKNIGTGREKGVIGIKTRLEGDNALIMINDDGIGIPREYIDRIYDPFFTTKEIGKGTGQGLAISHDIITKKHNGKIIVESEPGLGSTFSVYLPIEGEQK